MSRFILKMKDMTAQSTKDLCPSCSHHTQRTDERGVTRTCSAFSDFSSANAGRVHGRVVDCTDYYPKSLPSLRSMAEIAWDLSPSKKPGKIGFSVITPEDRKRRHLETKDVEFE